MVQSSSAHQGIPQWWGKFSFHINQSRTWYFGSLVVRLTRLMSEWRLEYYRPTIQHDHEQDYRVILDPEFVLPMPVQVERFMFHQTSPNIFLMPKLAPRPVVIRPNIPVYIPSGNSSTFFISTPLWIQCYLEHSENTLFELPIIQTKETWFGKNKQKGELCYVTSVDARTSLDALPPRAFRAVTTVNLYNYGFQQARFERMKVPVVNLPLFYSESLGRLVTSQIQVRYDDNDHPPKVRIGERGFDLAGEVQLIHQAQAQQNLSNLFELWT